MALPIAVGTPVLLVLEVHDVAVRRTLIFKHVVLWDFIVFKTTVNHTNSQLTTLCNYY